MMKTISADYNAITESDHLRLGFRPSQEDIERVGARPGDWAWLSDGEVMVGAQLAVDDRYGLVGVPDWDTLVHLDDEESRDYERVRAELQGLLQRPGRSLDEERRVLQLLTVFEILAPPEAKTAFRPGYFSFRRAATLVLLGKPELALPEIEEARRLDPGNPNDDRLFLEVLRRTDLVRATREAEVLAASTNVPAGVLAECINVLATHADNLSDDQFRPVADRILTWVDQFESAPGRDHVRASVLAQLQFNRGMLLLRLRLPDDARRALELAHAIDPLDESLDEATRLVAHDRHAREIAARVRSKTLAAA
jgi:hypothetical protein